MTSPEGHGVSLKAAHYGQLLEADHALPWAEAVTENFLGRGGRPWTVLQRVRRDTRVILHGVGMSLGGMDPFDETYFAQLRTLRDRIQPTFISDHLCFSSVDGHHGHDLWPLPNNEEALWHVVRRLREAQDRLGEELVIENVSSYVSYASSSMPEADFIAAILQEADAGMLLDVNNVHVSAHNLGFEPKAYIDALPAERIRYIHLAGHTDMGTHLIDDHGSAVCDEVWALYRYAIRRIGRRPTIVEWDCRLPSLERLVQESDEARAQEARALEASAA